MTKLTRTQKYASLRDNLANDKESTTTTQDLSSFADRFSNLQETLAPKTDVRPQTDTEYSWNQFTAQKPFDNRFEEVNTAPAQPVQEEPQNVSGTSYFDSFMADAKQQLQQDNKDFNSFFGFDNKTNEFDDDVKQVFAGIKDATDDSISRKERDTYLNQTISDVNVHNMANGEKTLDQIVNNAVNEVRHDDKPVEPVIKEEEVLDNTYTWEPLTSETILDADTLDQPVSIDNTADEDFTNTVTMEINNIMNQISPNAAPAQPVVQETAKVEVKPEVKQEPVVEQKAEPVAEQKAEPVVEIKNIAEVEDEPMRNTVSNTIPFVVSETDEEDIEEDDEDEGSNTVLNVILIVLIIVLIAVLGLIIFYILKTKGIL